MATKKKTAMSATVEAATTAVSTSTASSMVTVSYNSPRDIQFTLGKETVVINGNASGLRGKEKGILPVGKYGYTRIPSDQWEAIEKAYGSMAIFKNGLIFAESSKDKAEDRAEEQSELRNGLEPVDISTTKTEKADPTAV